MSKHVIAKSVTRQKGSPLYENLSLVDTAVIERRNVCLPREVSWLCVAKEKSAEIIVVERNEPRTRTGRSHKAMKDRTLSSSKCIVDAPSRMSSHGIGGTVAN